MPVLRLSSRVFGGIINAPLNQPTPNALNLNGMTKAQLLDYAAENGVEGVSGGMKKADIIAAIEEA